VGSQPKRDAMGCDLNSKLKLGSSQDFGRKSVAQRGTIAFAGHIDGPVGLKVRGPLPGSKWSAAHATGFIDRSHGWPVRRSGR